MFVFFEDDGGIWMQHIHGSYDVTLVIFSYIVAVAAAYTVLDLVGRISNLKGKGRLLWLLFGASAMGMGIWSMHFVGMLAFSLPIPVSYNIAVVIISVFAAIIGSFIALHLVSQTYQITMGRLISASAFLATGIVAMHYIGMAAMQIGITYRSSYVILSVIIAVVASFVALWLAFYFIKEESKMRIYTKLTSGLIMGAAIVGMHYIGMLAANFYINERSIEQTGVIFHQQYLGYFISGGTLFSLSISLLGIYLANKISFQDSELKSKTAEIYSMNEELKLLNSNLENLVKERTAQLEQAHDEAIKANMVKSQFLANMSHELRTPLNAIIGYSEMLAEEAEEIDESMFVEDLQKISNAGHHLLTLINDILDISKIEAGKMDIHLEDISIVELIEEVTATVAPLLKKNNNRLVTNIANGQIKTDVTKMRQILINLISNASKFTNEGIVTVRIVEEKRKGKNGLVFSIEDTGIGMTEEQMQKLFRPFTQADASTTRKYGGTGLGLAITRSFCDLLEGEISVTSEVNVGSIFSCWLPVLESEEKHDNVKQKWQNSESKVNILHIDDEPLNYQLMKHYLANEEWKIAHAPNGQEGLAMAKSLLPEVICLDILMPSMDGWSVLGALKNDEQLKHIPVIIWSMVNDEALGYSLGAAEYLQKPAKKEEVVTTFERYVKNKANLEVLVVEDDATTQELLVKTLVKEGYEVTVANNGEQAIEHLKINTPALILLDLMMPEMDGFQFIEETKEITQTQDIPIIVVTAKNLTSEEIAQLHTYVRCVMQKGLYKHQMLLNKIEEIFHE